METLRLSYSKQSMFTSCHRKYYYKYILKMKEKPKDYFVFGSFNHRVLELFFSRAYNPQYNFCKSTSELMSQCFMDAYKEEEFANQVNQQQLNDAQLLLQNYLNSEINSLPKFPNQVWVEKNFEATILNKIIINGYIDRIDFCDNSITVWDYKTSKARGEKSARQAKKDLQLPMYYLALTEQFNITPTHCGFYYLRSGHKTLIECEPKLLDHVRKTLDEVYTEITKRDPGKESDWEPSDNPKKSFCFWCDFKVMCKGINW